MPFIRNLTNFNHSSATKWVVLRLINSNKPITTMQKIFNSTSYFIIGYTILTVAVTLLTTLTFVPRPLRASIGMVVAAIAFVDLSYRYFRKYTSENSTVRLIDVIKLMAYWAVLSISLDVLILVIILPIIASGSVSLTFFSQQPSIYWLQFPMMFIFGFVSQAIYNRVVVITTAEIDLN